jgi:Protein of unknown function (DUF1569)
LRGANKRLNATDIEEDGAMNTQRRHIIITTALAAAGVHTMAAADIPKVQSLDDALRWLDKIEKSAGVKTTGAWPLVAVLEHLSQSIEMSVHGFPEPKSALFQNTVGTAALTVFKWRGRMSHTLSDPIPGAQVLTQQGDWKLAAGRLRTAMQMFNAHTGALKPHFAYGNLSKAEFALAHAFHIANHQDEIVVA